MAQGETQTSVDPLWYKDAIIYEMHVKTFCDSDGDGMGDFRGLIEKLDYLQELGITAIWLLPFYPSPLRDDGYDIADYFDVNPNFGTSMISAHSLMRRMREICASSRSWSSITLPIKTRGFKSRARGL